MSAPKTNVARLLDAKKIKYQLVPYIVDENNLAAIHIARQLNENIEQVFKTLVIKGDKTGIIVCVIPGNKEVNLKKVAKISSNKKVEMIAVKDLLTTTGYIRGGCSPIGMKKNFPTWFHNSCLNYEYIYVSAGVRGLQLKIDPKDLINYVKAQLEDIIE
jgi:ybaK/ebsC protein